MYCFSQVIASLGLGDDDVEWDGLASSTSPEKGKGKAVEHEEEFEDEEQLATVTVVEDFDPNALLHGPSPQKPTSDDADEDDTAPLLLRKPQVTKPARKPPPETKKVQSKTAAKAKAKSIKYQSNAARKEERGKQQKRKVEKAERAGGKSSRKSGRGRGKR